MALILVLEKRKMPKKVKAIYEEAQKGNFKVFIPSIVLAELAYLSEKQRIDTNISEVKKLLNTYPTITELPLSIEIIEKAFEISDVPELHDRLIAGTAKKINAPLLTNDPDINNSSYVKSIWK
jgi:predicted nucleic acid-binding protein